MKSQKKEAAALAWLSASGIKPLSGGRSLGKAIAKHPNKAQTSQASPAFCSLLSLLPSLENTHLCVCAKFVTVNTDAMAYFLSISLQLN